MANGRPWFVRYANSLAGLGGIHTGEIGPFDQPFQPSSEFEELALQADPLMYHEFSTEAEAQAWINSAAGKRESEIGSGPAGAASAAVTSVLGLPALSNLRDLVIRVMKVVIGGAMIIVGLVEIAKPGQILSKIPVIPA